MSDLLTKSPYVVQIYSFADDRWRNVIGVREGTTEPIYAAPDEHITLDQATKLCTLLNPSGMSAVHRVFAWHPEGHPSFFKK